MLSIADCRFILLLVCFLFSAVSGCLFQAGWQYTYQYRTKAVVNGVRDTPGFELACSVLVTASKSACEAQFQVTDCELKESDGKIEKKVQSSDKLSDELSKYTFKVKYRESKDNETNAVEFHASPSEKIHILNLKRGMVSAFQLPTLPLKPANGTNDTYVLKVSQNDIFGSCPTQVRATSYVERNITKWKIETSRDLVVCDLSHVSKIQQSLWSIIQVRIGGEIRGPISELSYAHESQVSCSYVLSNGGEMETTECQQTQALDPGRDLTKRELSKITQTMELISKTEITATFDKNDGELLKTDMAMDFKDEAKLEIEDDDHDNILSDDKMDERNIERVLRKIVQDSLYQGEFEDNESLEENVASVRRLVVLMRRMKYSQLSAQSEATLSCRNFTSCNSQFHRTSDSRVVQSIRERVFTKALTTCGSEACTHVFIEQWLSPNRLSNTMEETFVTINMGLFYTPTPDIAETLMNFCTKTKKSWCWVSISAMLKRMFDLEPEHKQTKLIIYKTTKHLLGMMGFTCKPDKLKTLPQPEKEDKENALASAVKALINLGPAAYHTHDALFNYKSEKTVLRSLLYCARNGDIRLTTAKDSVKALHSIGIQQVTVFDLVDLVQDESRPVVLRAAAFDVLITQNDFETLNIALSLFGRTRMEGVQTYIMTKVSSVLGDQDPRYKGLRATLRDVMKTYSFPKIGDKILSRSHVTHVSRYLSVPYTRLHAGGWVTLALIYTPESNVLHSLKFNFGIMAEQRKVNIADITLDLEGMDTILEVLEKQHSKTEKKLHSHTNPLEILDMIQDYVVKAANQRQTTYFKLHEEIRTSLEQLMVTANLRKAVFPRASLSIGLMGYEFGSVSSNDILQQLKHHNILNYMKKIVSSTSTKGIDSVFLHPMMVLEDRKVLPTLGGFIVRNAVDGTAVIKGSLGIKSDDISSGHARRSNKVLNILIKPSLSFVIYTDLKVRLPGYTSIGLDASICGALQGDLSFDVRLGAGKGSFSIQLSRQVPRKSFTFLFIDADSYTLRNGEKLLANRLPKVSTRKRCLPGTFTNLMGRQACIAVSRAMVSKTHPWSLNDPLRPFSLQGSLTTTDRNLRQITAQISHTPRDVSRYHTEFVLKAPGTLISRELRISMDKDSSTGSFHVLCQIPDADLTYSLESSSHLTKAKRQKKFASILTREGKCWNSFIYETSSDVSQNSKGGLSASGFNSAKFPYISSTHLNITLSGLLSLDITAKNRLPDRTLRNTDVVLKYYCHPRLRFLYALHPEKQMAAATGHQSQISVHQEIFDSMTSFAEIRRGFHKVTILLPAKNLTMVTTLKADMEGTHRNSDVYWSTKDGSDFLHTTSHVDNKTTSESFHYDYIMNATMNNEYDVIFEGHVLGPSKTPFSDLDIRADISYSHKNHGKRRSKRSLRTMVESLKYMEHAIEAEAVSLFNTVKSSLHNLIDNGKNSTDSAKTGSMKKEAGKGKIVTHVKPSRKSLWDLPRWSLGVIAKLSAKLGRESPIPGLYVVGPKTRWDIAFTMPKGNTTLFLLNGTAFRGRDPTPSGTAYTTWFRGRAWDQIHHLSFDLWTDQRSNPQEFFHQHNWTLVETDSHAMDRSFLARVHLQSQDRKHFNQFLSDVRLTAQRSNFSHHIEYNRTSPTKHAVKVFALLHNIRPAFDMAYIERTNIMDGSLDSQINLTSSLVDYQIDITGKSLPGSPLSLDGDFRIDSRLPGYVGERTLSTSLKITPQLLPVCSWIYTDNIGVETKGNISMLKPSLLKVNIHTNDLQLVSTLELIEPNRVQFVLTLPQTMLDHMTVVSKESSQSRRHMLGQVVLTLSKNMLLDLKDYRFPFSNNSLQTALIKKLKHAQISHGTRKAKVYKLMLGILDGVNELFSESFHVKAIRGLYLDKVVSAQLKSIGTALLSDKASMPPFYVRQFYKLYGTPTPCKMLNSTETALLQNHNDQKLTNKSRTFMVNAPLPVMMSGFNKPLRLTVTGKETMAMLKRVYTGTEMRTKHFAVIMQGWTIRTFDGKKLRLSEPRRDSCTYLLGGNLRHGQFALTYNNLGLTVSTQRASLSLYRDGRILSAERDAIQDLPYTTPDRMLSLTLHDSHPHISILEGKADVSFSLNDDFYVIEIDRRFNNASMGLLGTNNNEMGDDLRLPDGRLTEDTGTFQNSYELSGHSSCHVTTSPGQGLCQRFDVSAKSPCMSLSDQWQPAIPCLLVVDPTHFMLQCQAMECDGQSGCPAVAAYLDLCRHYGIPVGIPPPCAPNGCGGIDLPSIDIVIIYSLHDTLVSGHGGMYQPLYWIRHLIKGLSRAENHHGNVAIDARVGVVTYGGSGKWKEPRTILSDGKFSRPLREAHLNLLVDVEPSTEEVDANQAILMAADFAFRRDSVKVVFLIHTGQPTASSESKTDHSKMTKILMSKDTVLVTSAPYEQFVERGPIGQWADGELIITGPSAYQPKDPYNDVVKSTGGFWLDWNAVRREHHENSRTKTRGSQSKYDVTETVASNLHRLATKVLRQRCSA